MDVEEGGLMRGDLQDLLNAVETKRDQLNKLATFKKLTSEEVVTISRELDKLLNEVNSLSNGKRDKIDRDL
ncbi:aspartyl-phosphate phosphatase Spo0E family protein [Desulfosporosinus sp.]|uniref:aspartyl-phosphate phosphatase Spo0E family protein n=1 Tax=Desulfosporosinus sp. TaxID=157907 RepID=UPI002620A054|nr:aspartyl-phosphate phosphatase Spo0E family protein [Desulfosporosinus sp.]